MRWYVWSVAHHLTNAPFTAVALFEKTRPSVHVHTPSFAMSLPPSQTWSVQPAASTASRTSAFRAAEVIDTRRQPLSSQLVFASCQVRRVVSTWSVPSGRDTAAMASMPEIKHRQAPRWQRLT